jgi:hypothetical protein
MDTRLGHCQFDDGWPSEKSWHRGTTGWVAVVDRLPPARPIAEEDLLPESSIVWRKVEACEACARRLGVRP